MANRKSHIVDTVLSTLKQDSLTSLEGMVVCGTTRLGAHVEVLRKRGYLIRTENFVTAQGIRLAKYKRITYRVVDDRGNPVDARLYCQPDEFGVYRDVNRDGFKLLKA